MLRISKDERTPGTVTLRIEGQVIGQWVTEMRAASEAALKSGKQLVINMTEVTFLDRDAVGLFRELRARTVLLSNCSPFLLEQLREPGSNATLNPLNLYCNSKPYGCADRSKYQEDEE